MSGSPREEIETLRQRIEESPDIADSDADRLLEFSVLVDDDFRDRRHAKFLRYCTRMAEELDDGLLTAAFDDRDATEEIIDWIFRNFENDEINRNFRVALRVFAKRVSDGADDELPPSISWVPTHTSPDHDTNDPGHLV